MLIPTFLSWKCGSTQNQDWVKTMTIYPHPPTPTPPPHTHTTTTTPISTLGLKYKESKKVYTKYKTYSWKRLIAATRSAWASPISENVLIYPFAFKKSLNERKTYVTKIDIDFPCNLPMKETLNKSFSEKRHRAQRYNSLCLQFFSELP